MDGIICLWCGDRGCEECEPSATRTKKAFSDKRIAVKALKDIVELFNHGSEDMKDQAVRGIVAGEYARIALEQIKEGRDGV